MTGAGDEENFPVRVGERTGWRAMRLGRSPVVVWVCGAALVQAGCVGCGDLPVTYGGAGTPAGNCADGQGNAPTGRAATVVTPVRETPARPRRCRRAARTESRTEPRRAWTVAGLAPRVRWSRPARVTPTARPLSSRLAGVCAQCTDSAQCADGFECRAEAAAGTPASRPRCGWPSRPGSTVLRVRFSEPTLRTTRPRACSTPTTTAWRWRDETPEVCTPSDAFWLGGVLTEVDPSTVDIQLPFAPGGGRYTVLVSNVVDRANHALGSPRHADFDVGAPLQLLSATAQGPHRVLLTFQPVPPGSGRGECRVRLSRRLCHALPAVRCHRARGRALRRGAPRPA